MLKGKPFLAPSRFQWLSYSFSWGPITPIPAFFRQCLLLQGPFILLHFSVRTLVMGFRTLLG